MFNSRRGHDSRWCFNAQVKCFRGAKATALLHDGMSKCAHFNYSTLKVGDIVSAAPKKHFERKKKTKNTRQADSCKHEAIGKQCASLFLILIHTFCCRPRPPEWFSTALCLSARKVVLHTKRWSHSFRSSRASQRDDHSTRSAGGVLSPETIGLVTI